MSAQPPPERYELITIPVSHYCEKVRWALDFLGLPFIERPHMPPFHRSATKRHGGGSVPVLVTATGAVSDSDAILRTLDQRYPGRLYPAPLDASATALVSLFDDVLGAQTRRWGYSYILKRELLREPWTHGVPFYERWLFPLLFSKLEPRVRNMMQVTETSAAEARAEVMRVFDVVDARLADGRKYLLGDHFSGLDITFAALAAPILLPSEHHVPVAATDQLPPQMQADMAAARATIAGQFGLRLYRENRRFPASTA
jgi:glutathione S-transferase